MDFTVVYNVGCCFHLNPLLPFTIIVLHCYGIIVIKMLLAFNVTIRRRGRRRAWSLEGVTWELEHDCELVTSVSVCPLHCPWN